MKKEISLEELDLRIKTRKVELSHAFLENYICLFLAFQIHSVDTLVLNHVSFESFKGSDAIMSSAALVEKCIVVQTVLSDHAFREILKRGRLKHLVLDQSTCKNPQVKNLAQALASNSVLQSLSLCHNYIGDCGVEALAHALICNKTLTKLELEDNCFGDQGVVELARVLQRQNSTLKVLNLSDNLFEEPGSRALAKVLKHSSSLLTLVSSCFIPLKKKSSFSSRFHPFAGFVFQKNVLAEKIKIFFS
jgi:hypothetical protein